MSEPTIDGECEPWRRSGLVPFGTNCTAPKGSEPVPLTLAGQLEQFAKGPSIVDRWTAARHLMASKELLSLLNSAEFEAGFTSVGHGAREFAGVERLLAVDLVVRLSSFAKKLKPKAAGILADTLRSELPPASLVSDTQNLPAEAKPAEVRENVAFALTHASGAWVIPYIVRALAEEDRSQRCRLELTRQLAAREKSVELWITRLTQHPVLDRLSSTVGIDNAVSRLRDISAALAEVISQDRVRLTISATAAEELSRLCQGMVPISGRMSLPKRLGEAAAQVSRLLDELLSARLTLIVEPTAYAVVADFQRWWQPLPYPKPLQAALTPIIDKLLVGITLRARMGQLSESLSIGLRQAIGDVKDAQRRLALIAETEVGLTPEIQDWLRGTRRAASSTADLITGALRGVMDRDILVSVASLVLDASDVSPGDVSSTQDTVDQLRRLVSRVNSIANEYGLEVVGRPGDIVEYSPAAHDTLDHTSPREPQVRVLRPLVVRRRQDGGHDILVKALVAEAQQ